MDNDPPPDNPPKPTASTKLFANCSFDYNAMHIQVGRTFYAESDEDAVDLVKSGKATDVRPDI